MTLARPFHTVLVANRGEIAVRILRSCRALGLGTVAVYSDADRAAPHVTAADRAVRIGPPPPRESYLRVDEIVAAATRAGADAVHPGYGFLSENPALAEACAEAGLVFVGPSAAVIRALGSKREAKHLAAAAGVPIVPGYAGADQSTSALLAAAEGIGFPLLIKASAGGGGKGMRIVRAAGELAESIERARGEAQSAFADGTLLLERYLERPRHIEIQILGDHHGEVTHLWERECSLQRRHQKVIEEAPSPSLTGAQRDAMCDAAVALARAVGYASAGTVEMIVDADGAHYFLEVNTRLQVEHAVTEATCGVDLVVAQLRIARGEHLAEVVPTRPPPRRGHALEARLYAEDPGNDYLPAPGRAEVVSFPTGPGLRVDSGLVSGGEVTVHYDPMVAKLITHADTRVDAVALLAWALERTWIPGLTSNREHLVGILRHPGFRAGALHTHFLADEEATLRVPAPTLAQRRTAAAVAALAATAGRQHHALVPGLRPGWRNVPVAPAADTWVVAGEPIAITTHSEPDGRVRLSFAELITVVRPGPIEPDRVVLEDELGVRTSHRVAWQAGEPTRGWVEVDHRCLLVELAPRFGQAGASTSAGALVAPMPGRVVRVVVSVGDEVVAGAPLLVVEAMKMEHTIRAGATGTVRELRVQAGAQVVADQVLVVVA